MSFGVALKDHGQRPLDRAGQAEGDQERHQLVAGDDRDDEQPRDQPAEGEAERDQERQRQQRVEAQVLARQPGQVGAEQQELAVRQVDDAHDPEDQREALRHQGVEAAENDPVL